MKESINLLGEIAKEEGSLPVVPNKLASLSVIIILSTEIFFIFLLLLRLKYDRDLFLLRSQIEIKKIALAQAADIEKTIRSVQSKLTAVRNLRQDRFSFIKAVNYVPTLVPSDVSLLNFVLSQNRLMIVAKTSSGLSFAKMVENVSHSAKFSDLTLTGSRFDDKNGLYTFDFEAEIEKEIFKE